MPPLNQEIVNDTAKLIMHRLIARLLVRDPLLVDRAKVSLTKISIRFPDRSFVVDWEKLLRLPTSELRALLTSRNQDMKRLRLSSPFVTADGVDFGDQTLRRRIRRAAKRIVARASRPDGGRQSRPIAAGCPHLVQAGLWKIWNELSAPSRLSSKLIRSLSLATK